MKLLYKENFNYLNDIPIGTLLFNLTADQINLIYTNDAFMNCFNIDDNVENHKIYETIYKYVVHNIDSIKSNNDDDFNFLYLEDSTFYSVQLNYNYKVIDNEEYITLYIIKHNTNHLGYCNIANIIYNFNQPALIINEEHRIISANDSVYNVLKIPKDSHNKTDFKILNDYYNSTDIKNDIDIQNFLNNNSLEKRKFTKNIVFNIDKEDLTLSFKIIKLVNHSKKIYNLIIFDDVIEDILQEKDIQGLIDMAFRDHLCNIYNRRFFIKKVPDMINKNKNNCIMILDIDNFKKINDTYGHLFGDEVLKLVAKTANDYIKDKGIFARFGGEEFIGYINNISQDECFLLAEKIRKKIETTPVFDDNNNRVNITACIGVVHNKAKDMSLRGYVFKADKMLYKAKNDGRNKCFIHTVK